MGSISEHFKNRRLFISMFFLTVVIVVLVSVTIAWAVMRMSEDFFIDKFSITNSKVIGQVKDSFETYNYSIVIASNNLLQSGSARRILSEEESDYERMLSYFTLGQQMERVKSNLDAYDTSIMLNGVNGLSYSTDRQYWPIEQDELEGGLAKAALKEPKHLLYHYDYRPGKESYLVASRALREPISGNIYGTAHFAIKEAELKGFYMDYTSPGNEMVLLDKKGTIVSASSDELIGIQSQGLLQYAKQLEAGDDPYINGEFLGKEQIILMEYLPSFDMYLVNVLDRDIAFGDLLDKKRIMAIAIVIVLFSLAVVFFASRRLTKSLYRLVEQISATAQSGFEQHVEVAGTYETMKIGEAVNSMLDELHEYVGQLLVIQKEKRNAELSALQQQINPHFLYNTLTTIKFMVLRGSKEEAVETIHALISLLQNTVGNANEKVAVEQEVENLKNFVLINQKRYGDRIKVAYFVADDCRQELVPKLVLQPFMENAFFHAFNHKQEGYVNVMVWKQDGRLICEVADNGDGMELESSGLPDPGKRNQRFTGIGVQNVDQRIKLMYGEEYGVSISSHQGEGTTVRIVLPESS